MKDFRRLCLAVVLAAVFSVSALADPGATQGPPAPGDTPTPPGGVLTPSGAAGVTNGLGVTAFGDISSPGFLATLLGFLSLS
jgi:hypothetical protein